jgi:hypothetical protein
MAFPNRDTAVRDYIVEQPMRLTSAIFLLSICGFVMPGAEAAAPRMLTAARNLNRARQTHVDAEIALQQTIVSARQALLDDGYAAPMEVDTAKTQLRELQALRFQIGQHQAFLARITSTPRVAAWPSTDTSPGHVDGRPCPSDLWPTDGSGYDCKSTSGDLAIRLSYPIALRALTDCWVTVASTDELRSLSKQIAEQQMAAEGRLRALAAEAAYWQNLLTRLRRIDDGSASLTREMELVELRLAIQQRRIEMRRARQQYESCLEILHADHNRAGFPVQVGDETVTGPRQLSQVLEWRWSTYRVEAERQARLARGQLQRTYRDRLAAIDAARFGRPGEGWLWEVAHDRTSQELARVGRQLDHLHRLPRLATNYDGIYRRRDWQRRGMPKPFAFYDFPLVQANDRRATKALDDARQRIAQLARLAASGNTTANELRRARLEFAVHEAQWQAAEEEQTARYLAARVLTWNAFHMRNVSTGEEMGAEVLGDSDESFELCLISWLRAKAEQRSAQDLAQCRIELLKWKLAEMHSLHKLEYATWKEVAATKRDLARARADALAAREEQRIAELEYQRIFAATREAPLDSPPFAPR